MASSSAGVAGRMAGVTFMDALLSFFLVRPEAPPSCNHAFLGALVQRGKSIFFEDFRAWTRFGSFGIIGLGKMGADLALNALHHGYGVAGMDTHAVSSDLTGKGLKAATDAKQFVALLTPPRFIIMYVPAGPPVDAVLAELIDNLQPGDIIADGGNSYWGDSIRRHARLKDKGIHFIDAGTSGGPGGALDGACFMVGGEDAAVAMIEPILRKLAVEGGYRARRRAGRRAFHQAGAQRHRVRNVAGDRRGPQPARELS